MDAKSASQCAWFRAGLFAILVRISGPARGVHIGTVVDEVLLETG